MLGADHLNQPFAHRLGFCPGNLICLDNRVLAMFKRVIEVTRETKTSSEISPVILNAF